MTKELLEQYPDICLELKLLERSGRFPQRAQELRAQKEDIEAFVDSLPEPRQRLVVSLRALEGLSWQRVAGRMGYKYSEGAAKMIYKRATKNF